MFFTTRQQLQGFPTEVGRDSSSEVLCSDCENISEFVPFREYEVSEIKSVRCVSSFEQNTSVLNAVVFDERIELRGVCSFISICKVCVNKCVEILSCELDMKRFISKDIKLRLFLIQLGCCLSFISYAQTSTVVEQKGGYNPITTAVPFLNVTPDSRHSAMGDAGVATSPDINDQYWNPSKYAFIEEQYGFALSYTPWLRNLVNGVNFADLTGYYKLDDIQAFGSSLRYFSMGEVQLTDKTGAYLNTARPNEFAFDVSYSRKLSDNISGGVVLRYIHSALSAGSNNYTPGNAFAADVSFYFKNIWKDADDRQSLCGGVNLSNIGSKISYDNGETKEFLPANLRFGATYSNVVDNLNSFSLSLDFDKLLVPTPSVKTTVSSDGTIISSYNDHSDRSVLGSLFTSFWDAPGGFAEQVHEFNISFGAEYWYDHKFAGRLGYFYENANKGNRKFISMGVGMKTNVCSVDLSYLIPVQRNNPLSNTIRISMLFDINNIKQILFGTSATTSTMTDKK